MTSKEALKYLLVNSEELYSEYEEDIRFYLDAEKLYNIVLKDLDKLEEINNVWHKNEPMESVDINGTHLQEVYDFIHRLCEENDKLKKVIGILKRFNFQVYTTKNNNNEIAFKIYTDSLLETQEITQEEYDLLKELFGE